MKSQTKRVIGIDWSLNSPAICLLGDKGTFQDSQFAFLTRRKRDLEVVMPNVKAIEYPEFESDEERFDATTSAALLWILQHTQDCVVYLEGYAMGAKGLVFNIAECTGLLKHKMFQHEIPFHLVAPPTVKKYATGKGNADKPKMYEAFRNQGGPDLMKHYFLKADMEVKSPVTDLVDAYFLAKYGVASSTVAQS